MSSAGNAGIRRTTRTTTSTTGMSRCGRITNSRSSASRTTARSWVVPGVGATNPAAVKSTSASVMLGAVVQTMCWMWVNRSVPATAGARFVVSDSADILSPK